MLAADRRFEPRKVGRTPRDSVGVTSIHESPTLAFLIFAREYTGRFDAIFSLC